MVNIEKNDGLIDMMLGRIPERYHNLILEAVDGGISRQQLKLIEMGIHHGKSDDVLQQIRTADISTDKGWRAAWALAN